MRELLGQSTLDMYLSTLRSCLRSRTAALLPALLRCRGCTPYPHVEVNDRVLGHGRLVVTPTCNIRTLQGQFLICAPSARGTDAAALALGNCSKRWYSVHVHNTRLESKSLNGWHWALICDLHRPEHQLTSWANRCCLSAPCRCSRCRIQCLARH